MSPAHINDSKSQTTKMTAFQRSYEKCTAWIDVFEKLDKEYVGDTTQAKYKMDVSLDQKNSSIDPNAAIAELISNDVVPTIFAAYVDVVEFKKLLDRSFAKVNTGNTLASLVQATLAEKATEAREYIGGFQRLIEDYFTQRLNCVYRLAKQPEIIVWTVQKLQMDDNLLLREMKVRCQLIKLALMDLKEAWNLNSNDLFESNELEL